MNIIDLNKPASQLAYQTVKYQQRDGWSHRDLLRLSHPRTKEADRNALFNWMTHGTSPEKYPESLHILEGFMKAQKETDLKLMLKLITDYKLSREMLPTEFLKHPEVWEAMLPNMGLTAMIRNLANMTRIGLITDHSAATKTVMARLADDVQLHKARIHPMNVLIGTMTYQTGHGLRGQNTWNPVGKIIATLNDTFYASFGHIPTTGKDIFLGIDVSGSMGWPDLMGVPGLTPYLAAAAMAMTTVRTEPNHTIMGFSDHLVPLKLHNRMSLEEVEQVMRRCQMGITDCSLPMTHATKAKIPVDAFAVYTDNETWYGNIHPFQALKQYRSAMNRPHAKMIAVGFVGTNRTIADPSDPGMLDVVGFDSAVPSLIADFITDGELSKAQARDKASQRIVSV